jgi:hypothetical protein
MCRSHLHGSRVRLAAICNYWKVNCWQCFGLIYEDQETALLKQIIKCICNEGKGRAMAQAVSRRPLTTEARVRSQVKSM